MRPAWGRTLERGVVQQDGLPSCVAIATRWPLHHGRKAGREDRGQSGTQLHTAGWTMELGGGRKAAVQGYTAKHEVTYSPGGAVVERGVASATEPEKMHLTMHLVDL